MQQLKATVNAAVTLVGHLFSELIGRFISTARLDYKVEVLMLSLNILLLSLSQVQNHVLKQELDITFITDALQKCQTTLQSWIKRKDVIGGSFFGGQIKKMSLLYKHDEFKVCFVWRYVLIRVINNLCRFGRTYCALKFLMPSYLKCG